MVVSYNDKEGGMGRLRSTLGMKVMTVACSTCPFAGAQNSLPAETINFYAEKLIKFQNQHLCHSVDDKKICRGGRDLQLRLLRVWGIINEMTDEAFDRKAKEFLKGDDKWQKLS